MRKIITLFIFFIFCIKNVHADDKIVLMCNQYNTIDYIAVIDLKNRLFDMNELEKGFPENLRFKISKISDEKIIANAIETTNYKDGSYVTWDISILIDRYPMALTQSNKYFTEEPSPSNNESNEYLVRILDFIQASFKNKLRPLLGIFLNRTNVPKK